MTDPGPFEKTLTLTVTEAEIDRAKEQAARRLGQDVNIKGFRPGKAPRRLVEAAVGAEKLRREAIEQLLPSRVSEVLTEQELIPAITPQLEALRNVDDGVEADIKVTLWPELSTLPKYQEREFEVPAPQLTHEDLDNQIERIRDQFAHLEPVERPAEEGDFVSVDISAEKDDQTLETVAARDLLYELGNGALIEGADEQIIGLAAGESVHFPSVVPAGFGDLAGTEATFTVLVNEVKVKRLPELSDEWVADVTEFDTVDQLRDSLRWQLARVKERQIRDLYRQIVLSTLIREMEIELPDSLVAAEMDSIFHRFAHRLETEEISIEDYLELTGQDQETFLNDLTAQAVESLRTRLLLDRIAKEEDVQISTDEVEKTIENLVASAKEPEKIRATLSQGAPLASLASDILREKAWDALVATAIPVDPDGNRIVFQADAVESEPLEISEVTSED